MWSLIEKDNRLYVVHSSPLYNEPVRVENFYRVTASDGTYYLAAALEAREMIHEGSGVFRSARCPFRCGTAELPEFSIQTPIAPPRAKQTRWYQGVWQKYTKRGWSAA